MCISSFEQSPSASFMFEFWELDFSCYFMDSYLLSFDSPITEHLLLRTYYLRGTWHIKMEDSLFGRKEPTLVHDYK